MLPLIVVSLVPSTETIAPLPMAIAPPMTMLPEPAVRFWLEEKDVARLMVWVAVELFVISPLMPRAEAAL